jgi:hypothetical protein
MQKVPQKGKGEAALKERARGDAATGIARRRARLHGFTGKVMRPCFALARPSDCWPPKVCRGGYRSVGAGSARGSEGEEGNIESMRASGAFGCRMLSTTKKHRSARASQSASFSRNGILPSSLPAAASTTAEPEAAAAPRRAAGDFARAAPRLPLDGWLAAGTRWAKGRRGRGVSTWGAAATAARGAAAGARAAAAAVVAAAFFAGAGCAGDAFFGGVTAAAAAAAFLVLADRPPPDPG